MKIFILENFNYIDPGTGSYLYQAILAAGLTVGIYFKSIKTLISNFLSKIKKNKNN